jgi:hypothetical protein
MQDGALRSSESGDATTIATVNFHEETMSVTHLLRLPFALIKGTVVAQG